MVEWAWPKHHYLTKLHVDWLPSFVGVAYRTDPLAIGSIEDGRGKGAGVIWRGGRSQALSSWIECGRGAVASPWAVWAQVGVRMPVWAASTEYLHFANSGNDEGMLGTRWGRGGAVKERMDDEKQKTMGERDRETEELEKRRGEENYHGGEHSGGEAVGKRIIE